MMQSDSTRPGRARRRLAPSERYELYVLVLTGQATQREAVERWKVDRSRVVHICRVAKQGALDALAASVPGQSGQAAALAAAQQEVERLRATVAEQAVVIHLAEGKARGDSGAGPVPPRVDARVKAGLLDLVDHAVEAGWSSRQAAARRGIDDARLSRWLVRRAAGELADRAPGGAAVHGLLAAERAAIGELFELWGQVERSHRTLAHRGSRLELVHLSESTMRRVLTAEHLVLPGSPPRDPIPRTPWPQCLECKPHRIWA